MANTYLALCTTFLFGLLCALPAEALECRESTAPLFSGDRKEPLRMNFYAEHALVHDFVPPPHPLLPGILEYFEGDKRRLVAAQFETRGNSRMRCQPKPLKIEFEEEGFIDSLGSSPDPQLALQLLLEKREGEPFTKGVRQTRNLFSGLDNEIKLVNECKADKDWPGSPDPAIRKAMLLREYYVYQMLELLHPTALKSRLLESRFVGRDGNVYWEGYSILLEPMKDLRERCGLKKAAYAKGFLDPRTQFRVELLQAFIGNSDYLPDVDHNTRIGVDEKGFLHIIPYDYDLSDFARRDSMGWNFTGLEVFLVDRLGRAEYPERREMVRDLLAKKEEIFALFENSLLDQANKSLLKAALEKNFEILERLGR